MFTQSSIASEIKYILIDEQYEHTKPFFTDQTNIKLPKNKALLLEDVAGFSIQKEIVYNIVGSKKYTVAGKIEPCDGLQGKCLIIDEILKLYIPANFDDCTARKWKWQNYLYSTTAKKEYNLLGKKVKTTEIVAKCKECVLDHIRFEFDSNIGIISFKLVAQGVSLSYMLSSSEGFLSKIR